MRNVCIIAVMLIASPALADSTSPYEDAAKIDIGNLASMVLAASICPNVQFSSAHP